MMLSKGRMLWIGPTSIALLLGISLTVIPIHAQTEVSPPSQNAQPNTHGETPYLSMRLVDGTIKDISGKSITVGTDAGLTVVVLVQEAARIVIEDRVRAETERKDDFHVTDLRIG